MRELLAVALMSLLTGALFGVAGPMGTQPPDPPKPGIVALRQAQNQN